MMRKATCQDVPILKKIWKDIFGDTDSFINWFFTNRFSPDMSFVCEQNGKIASLLHTYPIEISLREKKVSAVMVSGVATLPQYRGQGLMHKLFLYALKELEKKGHYLCCYYPANPDFYKSLGHVNITENLVFNNVSPSAFNEGCTHFPLDNSHIPMLKSVYKSFMNKFSGFTTRNNDFEIKMQEYIGENLKVCFNLGSYIIYNKTESFVEIQELAGQFNEITKLLHSFEKPINGKLPPNFPTPGFKGDFCTAYGNMGGIINIQKFLAETGFSCPLLIEITDCSISHNNGVFNFYGEKFNKKADVTLTSGELFQTVVGYRVHPALKDYFPELNCYCQDLY